MVVPSNFGDALDAGRPPKTAAQLAADKIHARAYLEKHDAADLAEMLGV